MNLIIRTNQDFSNESDDMHDFFFPNTDTPEKLAAAKRRQRNMADKTGIPAAYSYKSDPTRVLLRHELGKTTLKVKTQAIADVTARLARTEGIHPSDRIGMSDRMIALARNADAALSKLSTALGRGGEERISRRLQAAKDATDALIDACDNIGALAERAGYLPVAERADDCIDHARRMMELGSRQAKREGVLIS